MQDNTLFNNYVRLMKSEVPHLSRASLPVIFLRTTRGDGRIQVTYCFRMEDSRMVRQEDLIGRMEAYQLGVIHELDTLCHTLLIPHASHVLDTTQEEPTLVARWIEHHLRRGIPAYDHGWKSRNYISSYEMCDQVLFSRHTREKTTHKKES